MKKPLPCSRPLTRPQLRSSARRNAKDAPRQSTAPEVPVGTRQKARTRSRSEGLDDAPERHDCVLSSRALLSTSDLVICTREVVAEGAPSGQSVRVLLRFLSNVKLSSDESGESPLGRHLS